MALPEGAVRSRSAGRSPGQRLAGLPFSSIRRRPSTPADHTLLAWTGRAPPPKPPGPVPRRQPAQRSRPRRSRPRLIPASCSAPTAGSPAIRRCWCAASWPAGRCSSTMKPIGWARCRRSMWMPW